MQFRALIADDQINNLDMIISKIKKEITDIDIKKVGNKSQILSNLEKINVLILSTTFNDCDSFELIKSINSDDLNIIFLTNNAKEDEEVDKACEIGVSDFISKPININKIISKLKHYSSIHKTKLELEKEKKISNTILNTTQNPIFAISENKVVFANKMFLELLKCKDIDNINDSFEDINDLFKSECKIDDQDMHDIFLTNKVIFGDEFNSNWLHNIINDTKQQINVTNEDGMELTYEPTSTLLDDEATRIIYLKDITKEIRHQNEMTNLLFTDSLTNLPNRTRLIDDLQDVDLAIKSLTIIDINSFKEINDFYGHRTGDTVIIGISELISTQISNHKNITFYKLPSDTYCLTNSEDDEKSFTLIIKKIIEVIEKKVFNVNHHEIDTRVTAGISFSTKNNKLITADLALQAAKKNNDDYLVFYDELDNINEYKNNMVWTKKLKNALANDKIIVYYQPLINNKTLKVDKYECLVRMIDDDKVISPFFFLDISKKSNQYAKITKVVIEKSFKQFSTLPFEFSVNVSYEDIEDPDFLTFIKEQLKKYNLSSKVVFEILEDENIKNYDILMHFINEVKALGCKVAIDDFGSGYSNFEHLLKMNVDYLKIDASLIKNIAIDENSYKVTKTIIEFANSLNLKTIAEFVENKEIFDIVKELGTDYSQGYYFSAPISMPNIYKASR